MAGGNIAGQVNRALFVALLLAVQGKEFEDNVTDLILHTLEQLRFKDHILDKLRTRAGKVNCVANEIVKERKAYISTGRYISNSFGELAAGAR